MKLLWAELYKVWSRRGFLLLLAALAAGHLLLLWVGGRPGPSRPAPESYRLMQNALAGLGIEEQKALVEADFARATGLAKVEEVYRAGAWADRERMAALREQNAAALAEYEQLYLEGGGLKYTASLFLEYRFLYEIKSELEQVAGYEGFIDGMLERAGKLGGISIFAEGEDYDTANIEATAAAYTGMRGTPVRYAPQKGLMLALGFAPSDVVLVLAMVLLAAVLARGERDSGLLGLVRAAPAGRLPTALAKLGALAASLLAVVVLLYGTALAFCGALYGLGPLGRPVQSVPALMRCTLPLTVWQYLVCFALAKWAAAFITGAGVMALVLWLRHFAAGCLAALALPGAALAARAAVPAAGKLNVLKYANLASLMNTGELLGSYRNLYWFGAPIPLPLVEGVAAVVFLILMCGAFLLIFCKAALPAARPGVLEPVFNPLTRRIRSGSTMPGVEYRFLLPGVMPPLAAGRRAKRGGGRLGVAGAEAYKLYVVGGLLALLALLAGLQAWRGHSGQVYLVPEEVYYQRAMRRYEGPYTAEKVQRLMAEREHYAPVERLDAALARGELDEENYWAAMAPYYDLQMEYGAFLRLGRRLYETVATPGAELVYEAGYGPLFGTTGGNADLHDVLLCVAACAAGFAALAAADRPTARLLAATPLGRRATGRAKLGVSAVGAAVVAALSLLPRYWQVGAAYGFSRPGATLASLPEYAAGPGFLPIWALAALGLVGRVCACLAMAWVVALVGARAGAVAAAGAGGALFGLPALLALVGVGWARWLSAWPLFHLPALFTSAGMAAAGLALLAGWAALAAYSGSKLLRWWRAAGLFR